MTDAAVTVVIPTYDGPDDVRRCLDALRSGVRQPEFIMVFDQSRGCATADMVARFPNVTYTHLPVPNASAARQAGLLAANTTLVAFTDDDCVPDPGWLDALVTAYQQELCHRGQVAAVTGRVLPLPGSKGLAVGGRASTVRRVFCAQDGSLNRAEWGPWDVGGGGNVMVDRSLALAAGGWDPSLGPGTSARAGEDVDFLYRVARAGVIVFTPAAVIFHTAASRRDRLARRYPYGRGMGACLAKHLALRDPAALPLLSLYLRHMVRSMTRSVWGPVEGTFTFAGFLAGFATRILRSEVS